MARPGTERSQRCGERQDLERFRTVIALSSSCGLHSSGVGPGCTEPMMRRGIATSSLKHISSIMVLTAANILLSYS